MTKFSEINKEIQNKFTLNSTIRVTDNYFDPNQYQSLIIPNWNNVINDYINNFTKEKILSGKQGKENYPKGACQYKEGGASYYICKCLDKINVTGKTVGVIGSENPWIEAILYNYGCRNIVTIEYNKPHINHSNFKVINFEEFKKIDYKFDLIVSFSSIEHSGLGRYGDEINPDGDIETTNLIYDKLNIDGKMVIGIPIGLDTLVWNANRIYGRIRLPMLLKKFIIKEWVGGDESCLNIIPMYGGIYTSQPILICEKNNLHS